MKLIPLAGALLAGFASATHAQSLAGLWDAQLIVSPDYHLPFPIEFSVDGNRVTAAFFNGDERVTSTSGTQDGSHVAVEFGDYDSHLEATLENGVLKGKYGGARGGFREFEAKPHAAAPDGATGPGIGGLWDIPHDSPKGEKAWHFIVRQNGAEVSAAILRVDGDTGTFRGTWQQDRYVLNLFDGARGSTLEVVPQADGTLALNLRALRGPASTLTAFRADVAKAQGLPEPTDPEHHTRLKDPSAPLQFSFPDRSGHVVSNTDERFRGKVVLINITGSWCPNCHDEAPFLSALYKKYHPLGLEVVALDFEDASQLTKLTRLDAFIKKFDLGYTYLIAGEPKELQAKVPQAENLNAFPTTFFVGRDGLVHAIHAGFAAPASGQFNTDLVASIDHTVETLLAAPGGSAAAAN
jgi:thiol-disulfide isomerase/thioredoxin